MNYVCCILGCCSVTVPDLQLHGRPITDTAIIEIIHPANMSFSVKSKAGSPPYSTPPTSGSRGQSISSPNPTTVAQHSCYDVTMTFPASRWHSCWVSEPQPEDCSAFPTMSTPYSVKVFLELTEQPTLILEYGIGEAKAGTSCVTKIRTWAEAVRAQAAWTRAIVLECWVCWLCFQWADGEIERSPVSNDEAWLSWVASH